MLKVLMTGSRGFVGSATRKLFEEKEIEVIGYDLLDGKDIRDFDQLEEVIKLEKPDRILHLAAIARFAEADKNPVLAFETNAQGTLNVSKVASKYHIPIVCASTGSVYMPIEQTPPITEEFLARGNSVYGCSKLVGEQYAREFKNPWIILRYAHLYGKEKRMHGLIGGFLDRINRGRAPILMGGRQSNDFCYILDIAEANYLAVTASWDKWNNVFNIGTGEELTAEEAGKIVCETFNYHGDIEKHEARTVDPLKFVYDISKARTMLGFNPRYNFHDGLNHMKTEIENDKNSTQSKSSKMEN